MKLIKENFDSSIDRERRIFDYKSKHLIESVEKEIKIKENINQDLKVSEDKAKVQLQGLVDQAKKVLGEVGDGLKADIAAAGFTLDNSGKVVKTVNEDVKKLSNGKWANVGKDGKADSGEFKTKKEADAQRKAMFANGYKESIIRYPNGMEVTDIDLDRALDYQYGTDRDKDNSKYTDDEKQRAVNYWIKKTDSSPYDESKVDSGKFTTKKEVDAQRKAMFANGYKGESLEEKTEECLTEDVEIEIETKDEPKVEVEDSDEHSVENVPEMPETNCKMIISNLINPLIQDELQAIDGYNSAVATIRGIMEDSTHDNSIDYEGIIAVISEITNEENVHIGQLEKLLEMVSPNAESIDDGKEEAEEQLAETKEKKAEETTAENKE